MGFLKYILKYIREIFWPLLEGDAPPPRKELSISDLNVEDEKLEYVLDKALKEHESEMERKKTVESKSSLFVGIIGIITAVILGITASFVQSEGFDFCDYVGLITFLFVITVYMARTAWFSLKALETRGYEVISVQDFLISDSGSEYYRNVITEIVNKIRENSSTINEKVDYMTMAQEYFKRALVAEVFYVPIILLHAPVFDNFRIDPSLAYLFLVPLSIVVYHIPKAINKWKRKKATSIH